MKKIALIVLLTWVFFPLANAQKYEMTFVIPKDGQPDSILYIGVYYRDQLVALDRTRIPLPANANGKRASMPCFRRMRRKVSLISQSTVANVSPSTSPRKWR